MITNIDYVSKSSLPRTGLPMELQRMVNFSRHLPSSKNIRRDKKHV